MGEDGVDQLFFRGFQIHRDDETLNELGDLRANHVSAKQRAGLGVENRFYEALVLPQGNGFAVTYERKAAHPYIAPFGLCPDFSQANGSDLGMAIGTAGNSALFQRMGFESLDLFDTDHTLVFRLMCEHGRSSHVSNPINARHIGAAVSINDEQTLFDLDAQLLQSEVLDIADNAYS